MEMLRNSAGFFGPNSDLLTDITLVVQILFYLVLCAGVVAQLQKRYKWHDMLQTPVVILNIFFIAFVMVPSFLGLTGSLSTSLLEVPVMVTATHAMLGTVAQLLSVYCLLAGLKILPRKIGVLRYWMWGAFTAWTAAIVFGIGVYIVFYTNALAAPPPPVQEQPAETDPGSEIISEHDEQLIEPPPAESEPTATPLPEQPADTAPTEASPTEPQPADEPLDEHAEDSSEDSSSTPEPEQPVPESEAESEADIPTVAAATEPPADAATPTPELISPETPDDVTSEHDGG